MKKSDIAIYISAVLTLILTTFVVFSTQNVTTYDEKKIDDILKKQNTVTSNTTATGSAGDSSPLFDNKINKKDDSSDKKLLQDDTKSDDKKSPVTDSTVTVKKKKSFADINSLDILDDTKKKSTDKPKSSVTYTSKKPVRRKAAVRPAIRKNRIAPAAHNYSGRTYTVRYGDTMWKIAERYGISTLKVVRANSHLRNPNVIYPGMKIRIP